MRAAARNAPQVRRPSVSAAGGNLEIGRIHFGRFESDHGVPGESGAFCGASSSIKPDNVRGVIFAIVETPFRGMRAAARNAPQVRRPSVSAAGGNLEIGRIHFGRFESDHGVPGESGAFCGASSSIKPDRVRGVIFAMVIAPFLGVLVWRRKNKRSRPLALGRERLPLRGATQIQGPAGLLLPPVVRGGCRGRLRPRSAAVLRPGRPGRSQRCAPLCGAGDWSTAAASARYLGCFQ